MLIIIIVIIFNLNGIGKEFVCTLMHIKHYEDTDSIIFFPMSVCYLALECVTILLLLLCPEHPQRSNRLGQTMSHFWWIFTALVIRLCSCLSYPCSFSSAILPISSSLQGLGEQADLDLELISMTSCFDFGQITLQASVSSSVMWR